MGLFGGDDSWQDHGPGTLEWDYMFGGNHTGLYEDKKVYAISDDRKHLNGYVLEHSGGHTWTVTGSLSWDIEKFVVLIGFKFRCVFYVPSTEQWIKATESNELKHWDNGVLVTIEDIDEPDEAFKNMYYGEEGK